MKAAAFLIELTEAGIRLCRNGDRLHVEAPRGAVTAELRERLAGAKHDLLALLDSPEAIRAHLLGLANLEGLAAGLVHDLDAGDLTACVGSTESELRTFLRALGKSAAMDAGRVPPSFTVATRCPECGPVWLSEPLLAFAQSCPWCFRRKAGKKYPSAALLSIPNDSGCGTPAKDTP